jgi:hypothetical protein
VVAVMLLALPIVKWQGPAHTTVMDAVNVLFLGVYWLVLLARRERVAFPLLAPFWMILLGSAIGLFFSTHLSEALLTLGQDVYLYLWFVTLAHFLVRHCRLPSVATAWVTVASLLAFLAAADHFLGVFGGFFGGGPRATGTFENPNMFGDYLNVAFFLAWAVAAGGQRILFLAMPVLLAGVLATASNGSLMSLGIACAVTAAATPARRPSLRIGSALVAAAFAVAVFGLWDERMTNALLERMSRGRSAVGGAAMEGAEERFPIWLDGLASLQRAPLGVGPANFNAEGGGEASRTYHGPHNEYLGMLVERGPLGFIGWCTLVGGMAVALYRLGTRIAAGLAVPALCGAVAMLAVHATVAEVFHFRHFWFAFALLTAVTLQTVRVLPSVLPTPAAVREAA